MNDKTTIRQESMSAADQSDTPGIKTIIDDRAERLQASVANYGINKKNAAEGLRELARVGYSIYTQDAVSNFKDIKSKFAAMFKTPKK